MPARPSSSQRSKVAAWTGGPAGPIATRSKPSSSARLFTAWVSAIAERAGRALPRRAPFAFVAFHADQWRETGRRSRFAWDETQARAILEGAGFAVEHLSVEREVREFASLQEALAAAVGLEDRWRADGRWFRYIKFLEEGGRTLTRAHLHVKARKA